MKLSYILLLLVALLTINGDVAFASYLPTHGHHHHPPRKSLVPHPSPVPAPSPFPSHPPSGGSDSVVPVPAPNSGEIVIPPPSSSDDGESPASVPDVADGTNLTPGPGPAPASPKQKSGALANTISYVLVFGSVISLSFSLV